MASKLVNTLINIVGAAAMASAEKELTCLTMFLPVGMGNKKVGALTSTYSPRATCPPSCPFKACGACYAEHGNARCWFNVAGGQMWQGKYYHINISELKSRLQTQSTTHYIRHNVSGDLCTGDKIDINPALVAKLAAAYKGHKAYTYTHAPTTARNLAIIQAANNDGAFIINKSCENIEQVKACIAAGVPAVLAVDKMPNKKAIVDGITFEKCPATYKEGCTCASCKKCANRCRKNIIVFPVHGPAANSARRAGFLISELK